MTMRNNAITRSLTWMAVAASLLITLPIHSATSSFLLGCAARDLQVLVLIEQQESTRAISADGLRTALFKLFDARIVCHEGRVVDALAIYDDIAQSIRGNP